MQTDSSSIPNLSSPPHSLHHFDYNFVKTCQENEEVQIRESSGVRYKGLGSPRSVRAVISWQWVVEGAPQHAIGHTALALRCGGGNRQLRTGQWLLFAFYEDPSALGVSSLAVKPRATSHPLPCQPEQWSQLAHHCLERSLSVRQLVTE